MSYYINRLLYHQIPLDWFRTYVRTLSVSITALVDIIGIKKSEHAPSIVVDGSNSLDEESAHKLSEESTESADAKIDEPRYVVYQNEGHIETELGPDGNPLAGSKRQRKPSQRMKGDIVVPASAALKNYTQPVLLTARELSVSFDCVRS